MNPIVEIRNVHKIYTRGSEKLDVLQGVTVQVAAGEFLALMGPSGSGKTTLLNLMAGIDTPSSGEVIVNGRDISKMGEDQLAAWRTRNVGYVFQSFNLVPVLTAYENVELPLLLLPLDRRRRHEQVMTSLEVVGLADRKDHLPRQLSGGQEQRVAIARAIVTDPPLVLADEPTGDLDRENAKAVMELVGRVVSRVQQNVRHRHPRPEGGRMRNARVAHGQGRARRERATLGGEPMKFLFFAFKSLSRNPVRTTLTLLGVGVAIFLFTGVVSLDQGMRRMLANSAGDDTLVVFDKYQGCPPLSKLPTSYEAQVAELSGVAETTPTLFLLSACSRATDLVAVHGIEPEKFRRFRKIDIPEEQYRAFSQERGAAIVGEKVARTYGWRIGQAVTLQKLGDISFTVRGIFRAPGSSLENAILVDLDYLQFATNQTGKMTLLLVKVSDPARAGAVAERVDALFSSSASPTKTTPERSFIASAISGVTGIVEFSRWLGYVALGIILVGVGNSLAMTIRDRTREFAILKTLGFRRPQVLRLVIFEAVLSSLLGGALGAGLAWLAVNRSNLSLSVEGFTIAPHVTLELALLAVALAGVLGTVAAVLPAINASRLKIVQALREVD